MPDGAVIMGWDSLTEWRDIYEHTEIHTEIGGSAAGL